MNISLCNENLKRWVLLGFAGIFLQAVNACTTTDEATDGSDSQQEIEAGENPDSNPLEENSGENSEAAENSLSAGDESANQDPQTQVDESLSSGDIGTLEVGAPVDVPALPEVVEEASVSDPMLVEDKDTAKQSLTDVAQPAMEEYIVLPGDTLAKIAKKLYGTTSKWQKLAADNQLKDANKIFPGDKLSYASESVSETYKVSQSDVLTSIVVKKGQNLSSIAKSLYGNSSYWRVLWRLNEAEISNPNSLSVGTSLKVLKGAQAKDGIPSH